MLTSSPALARTVRLWALVDGAVTGLFVLPPVATQVVSLLFAIDRELGGSLDAPPVAGLLGFFISLAGVLGVLWAIARWLAPEARLCRLDAGARLYVAALIIYFVAQTGAPRVLLLFVVTEVAGSLHQWWALRRMD